MTAKLVFQNQRFYFIGDSSNREKLKQSGFKWDQDLKLWFTEDKFKALLFCEKFDFEYDCHAEMELLPLKLNYKKSSQSNRIEGLQTNNLQDFQSFSVNQISKRNQNFLLADEQGLGKTVQIAGVINELSKSRKHWDQCSKEELITIVILSPSTLKLNWRKELEKWLNKPWHIGVISGENGMCNFSFSSFPFRIIILNYDILSPANLASLRPLQPDLLILDEAHYLKNKDSQRTQKILLAKDALIKYCKKTIALTGTPITKHPVDIFPICAALCPESIAPYNTYWKFAEKFCNVVTKVFGKEIVGSKNEEELALRLRSTFMIRREKKDVLKQLPPKQYQIITLAQNKDTKVVVRKETLLPKDEIEMAIQKQEVKAVGHLATIRKELALAKLPECIKFIEDELESVDKIVVFAWHKEVIKILQSHFTNRKDMLFPAVITGETCVNERQIAVNNFQNKPECKLFIGNIQAAGVGITLTAASRIIFIESSWLPSEIDQAIDRCHRIGQNDNVLAQFLVVEESIDARVLGTVVSRMKNINKII
ncbi:MAG: DEAD/DEAH box helicase [Flavobacterium sp.]